MLRETELFKEREIKKKSRIKNMLELRTEKANFVSFAHTEKDLDAAVQAHKKALEKKEYR